ncbi:hypothetical protein [Actinoplanes sp. NPDC020271]|uniref:hypothetical protein n=1 Tax=Actinoplanes sp. NPDC020271 TaxID=3363896 RepID=UPI003789B497
MSRSLFEPGPDRLDQRLLLRFTQTSLEQSLQSAFRVQAAQRGMGVDRLVAPPVATSVRSDVRVGSQDRFCSLPGVVCGVEREPEPFNGSGQLSLGHRLRLRDEFAQSLGLSYVAKRGEKPPEHDAGCTLQEAALALACADPDIETITRAKQNPDALFETGPKSIYPRLFNPNVDAYRVWRSVCTLRAVGGTLESLGEQMDGRGAQIARHGDLAVAHLVFHQMNAKDIANADVRWEQTTLPEVPEMTRRALHWLIAAVDEHLPTAYAQSMFKSENRVRTLVQTALHHLRSADDAPQPPQKYRRTTAIDIIVNRGLIADGTTVEFRPTAAQRKLLSSWLKDDESRNRASWVNDRARPLVWAFDGKQYVPTDLIKHMLSQVTDKVPARGNGLDRWFVAERGSLAAIAAQARTADIE